MFPETKICAIWHSSVLNKYRGFKNYFRPLKAENNEDFLTLTTIYDYLTKYLQLYRLDKGCENEQGEKDKKELEEKVLINIKQLIIPYVNELKKLVYHPQQRTVVEIIESNLEGIISSFAYTLSQPNLNLTPKELMIANLIKQGKTTKEICDLMRSSEKAVSFHRGNIRKKLGLLNKKTSLKSSLIAKA